MVGKSVNTVGSEIILTVVFAFEMEFQFLNFGNRNFFPNTESVGMEVEFGVDFISHETINAIF